jgi:hypothetical protein
LEFKRYDESYNPVLVKQYFDTNYAYFSGWNIEYLNDNYYYAGFKRNLSNPDTTMSYLIKFDTLGNVLWEKNYFSSSINSRFGYTVVRDTNLYVLGYLTPPGSSNGIECFVMELDTSGNVNWVENLLGTLVSPVSLAKTQDGGFLISTFLQLGFYTPTKLFKLDSAGATEWSIQLTKPTEAHVLSVAEMPNGEILCYGYSQEPVFGRERSWLVKLDANGTLLIDTLFDYSLGLDIFSNVSPPLFYANEFQLLGVLFDDETTSTAKMYIARYDYDFNLKWKRIYYERETDNDLSFHHNLDDGFVLFAGNVRQDNASTTRDEWFLVLDSLGCNTPNCAVGLEELKENEFLIYPNPTSTTINIDFKEYSGEGIEVKMINLSGEIVGEYHLLSNLNSINVQHLKPGVYFISIGNDSGELQREKIIVQS